jgi:flagellar motor switch protein FliM
MADQDEETPGEEAPDQDAMAAEWAAAADDGSGDTSDGEGGGEDQDAMATEWEAMADDGGGDESPGSGGGEDEDAMAAEWEAMAGDGDDDEGASNGGAPTRVLNQDEIDSLLGFDDGEDDGARTGIKALFNNTMVSYERLPMLEVVFDRVVRLLTTSLRNFTSDNVEVSIDGMDSVRFGDYLNSIPLPAMLAVFKAEEWDDFGLITIDSALIYSVVDVLLGGGRLAAPIRIEGRPYTTIERNLVERMIHVVLADLDAAFEPLTPISFKYDRLETNPRFATIARPANAAVKIKLRVDMDERGGNLEIIFPYATLEPIRELLLQMFLGEKFGRDSIWETHLATELWQTNVQIDALLDQQTLPLREIADLSLGDTFMLHARPDSKIVLRCGGVPMMYGRMGRAGANVAVCVESKHQSIDT